MSDPKNKRLGRDLFMFLFAILALYGLWSLVADIAARFG